MIFNTVLTGHTFWHLRFFVCSLIEQTDAQFRLVANGCTTESIEDMQKFAARHRDRVVEVFDASPDAMVAHGVALDAVRRERADGEFFAFVDPDIMASGPFLPEFVAVLQNCDAVTAGKELWTDDNVLADGHAGVGGRHFYDARGFVFGSPHFAIYRRDPLDATCARWGVGLGSAGPELDERARQRLATGGHEYLVYDTGKIVNILLQLDGHRLVHREHPDLIHVGGLSHFLAPGGGEPGGECAAPSWTAFAGMEPRSEVARYTAAVVRAEIEHQPRPEVPEAAAELRPRLERVRDDIAPLVARYRDC